MVKIGFGQATYSRDFEETKECIKRVSPYVDTTIISYDQSLTDDQIKWLEDNIERYRLQLVCYIWTDDMPAMRNSYLKIVKELDIEWLCVSDPDELFSEELAKNIRFLIEKYGKEGYSILGVPVRDQFSGIGNDEWFDSIDRLKEYPAGYRETEYWKPMLIFKIFPDIRYEGIGIEKKVHETLLTQYKQKTINLSKEYFYVHKKNVIKIWRNAARNMFISGGGDNVGSKNRVWVELRQICGQMEINTWNEFEEFVKLGYDKWVGKLELSSTTINTDLLNGKLKKEFRLWLEAALKALPTKEGTETRETAKWYLALHKDEVDQKILTLIKTVPEVTKESELENFVTQTYYQILGRHPDRTGLDTYVQKIMNKEIKRHELVDIFKNSLEHKEKFSNIQISFDKYKYSDKDKDYKAKLTDEERLKYDKIQKFVEQIYNKVLGRSADLPGLNYYTKAIIEKRIKPVYLPDIFRKSEEYSNVRGNRGKTSTPMFGMNNTVDNIDTGSLKYVNKTPSKKELKMINIGDAVCHNTVSLCIMGISSELPMIKESIMNIKNVVDEIHIQSDDFTEEDIEELKDIDKRINVHIEKWKDDFSDYKNRCYSHATTEWCVICDADEIPTKELADNLKDIIEKSNIGNNYDMVAFDVIDVTTIDDKIVSTNRNKGGKTLLHWNIPSIYTGRLHVWIKEGYYPFKSTCSDTAYKHIKEKDSILERSARNVWIGGGGDTLEDKNSLWRKLRDVSKELGFEKWKDFKEYCQKGNIDIRILDIFGGMCNITWKDEELKDLRKWYIKIHPEEEGRFN